MNRASNADGLTAKVYCQYGSTTAVFSGDTANYTLRIPRGWHTVTMEVPGYWSKTIVTDVPALSPTDYDFFTSSSWMVMDVMPASPERIAPDGVSETTVTAIVRDIEGHRLPNEPVNWSTDAGTIVTSDSVTNTVGEATATVRSSTNHETATITAQSNEAYNYGYVEYADEGDPHIRLIEPYMGDSVSGIVTIRVVAYNAAGPEYDGLRNVRLYVDGEPKGCVTRDVERGDGFDTTALTNGAHELVVQATDFGGNVMWSQKVTVNVYNTISEILAPLTEIYSDDAEPDQFSISGCMNETGTWELQIVDPLGNVIYTESGSEGMFQCVWDCKVNGSYSDNLHQAILFANGVEVARRFPTVSKRVATVLITCALEGEREYWRSGNIEEVTAVADACRAQGLYFTMVRDPKWEPGWGRPAMKDLLLNGYKYWFHTGHGAFVDNFDDEQHHVTIDFNNDPVLGDDYWLPIYKREGANAFSDLNPDLIYRDYRLVMINACNSAGSSILFNIDNSIAHAFGIYDNPEYDNTYMGWTSGYVQWFPRNGTPWTKNFWCYLGMGYTVSQAQGWANFLAGSGPLPMQSNLLTYGGPDATYLTW